MKIRLFLSTLLSLLCGCSHFETLSPKELAKRAALRASLPLLEKFYDSKVPVAPSSRTRFPTVDVLPGASPFSPWAGSESYAPAGSGKLKLKAGDYEFVVLPYCLKASGSSPPAHRYTLARLSGARSQALRDLHARSTSSSQWTHSDIQMVSWKIQSGVPFNKFTPKDQQLVSALIHRHQDQLNHSFLDELREKWNQFSKSTGAFPSYEATERSLLADLGPFGQRLAEMRDAHADLIRLGNDYRNFSERIGISASGEEERSPTPWSQLGNRTFARFVTEGRFLQHGRLQVRVMPEVRSTLSETDSELGEVELDIASLVGDPDAPGIQPLGLSPMVFAGTAGVLALNSTHRSIVAALLLSLIAAQYTDWEAVSSAISKWGKDTSSEIQAIVDRLREMYSREFGAFNPGQYIPPPAIPEAFPDLVPGKPKTVTSAGKKRRRWTSSNGDIYEWDSRHGSLERYDSRGKHKGEYDPKTGKQLKPADGKKSVEP
jgi:hypothetical protein